MKSRKDRQQSRKSFLRKTVRKFGRLGSVLLLTLVCDLLSIFAVYTLRMSIVGTVKVADLIVGIIIPTVLVPLTSAFYIFLIKDLDQAESELEKALDFAEKAQSFAKTNAVGAMAAGIAHEINNPLAIIRGRTEMVKALFDRGQVNAEKFAVFHNSIVQSSDRIAVIIKGMRTMALVDAVEEPAQLLNLIEQTMALFHGRAEIQSTKLILDLNSRDLDHGEVVLNSAKFMQVLTSLIGNALDAVEQQADAWVKIRFEEHPDFAWIGVLNSGPLIDDDLKPRLMEPFFSTKPMGKGTVWALACLNL